MSYADEDKIIAELHQQEDAQAQAKRKPNPYNSAAVQAVIDIIAAMDRCSTYETDIHDLLHELQDPQSAIRPVADEIMMQHRYPDKKLRFCQSLMYDGCPQRFALSRAENAILDLMEKIQSAEGYVAVQKQRFAEVLQLTDGESRNLQNSLDHLAELGFINAAFKPPQGCRKPGIYMINRAVTWVGRRGTGTVPGDKSIYAQVQQQYVLSDGSKIKAGGLDYRPTDDDTAKEPASDVKADASSIDITTNDDSASIPFAESEINPPDCSDWPPKWNDDDLFTADEQAMLAPPEPPEPETPASKPPRKQRKAAPKEQESQQLPGQLSIVDTDCTVR